MLKKGKNGLSLDEGFLTWRHEIAGRFLWAPMHTKNGGPPMHHWLTMITVKPGDFIFSYVDTAIKAVAIAKGAAQIAPRPQEFGQSTDTDWAGEGWRVEAEHKTFEIPLPLTDFVSKLRPLLPDTYSPLQKDKDARNQGYLFAIPPRAGRFILDRAGIDDIDQSGHLCAALQQTVPDQTERAILVQSRIGQGQYRSDVLDLWGTRCAVLGLAVPRLLRASHIKPWRDSNNAERVDPYNGIALSPCYDALFDCGYISARIDPEDFARLGIHNDVRIVGLTQRHVLYLAHHRSEVFQ